MRTQFAESGGLEHVIVVNVASTEPAVDHRSLAAGSGVKSQLRGYDLGPPFPAGFRDSGLVNGYAEGEWVPFVAVVEGRKLAEADAGDGSYRVTLIVPTYSPRHAANGISDLAVTGTYGLGALTPIPEPISIPPQETS